jgi:hypothetical protein
MCQGMGDDERAFAKGLVLFRAERIMRLYRREGGEPVIQVGQTGRLCVSRLLWSENEYGLHH